MYGSQQCKLGSASSATSTYLVSDFENHHISGILTALMQVHKEAFFSVRSGMF